MRAKQRKRGRLPSGTRKGVVFSLILVLLLIMTPIFSLVMADELSADQENDPDNALGYSEMDEEKREEDAQRDDSAADDVEPDTGLDDGGTPDSDDEEESEPDYVSVADDEEAALLGNKRGLLRSMSYTVTFMVGSEEWDVQVIQAGTLAELPEEPVGTGGERFHAWYDEDDNPFSFIEPVTENITLHAVFGDKWLVHFLNYDGSQLAIVGVDDGDPLPVSPVAPTPPLGEDFGYWSQTQGGGEFTGAVNNNLTLYPVSAGQIIAFFVTNGSAVEPQKLSANEAPVRPGTDPTRTGYTFSHWSLTEDSATVYDFSTGFEESTHIYAVWTARKVGYILNFWNEKINIPGDPGTNLSNYELIYTKIIPASHAQSAFAGTQPDITAATTIENRLYDDGDSEVFSLLDQADFYWADVPVLSGYGDTVVNVYCRRIEYTIKFDLNNVQITVSDGVTTDTYGPASGSYYTIQTKLGLDQSAIWPRTAVKTSAPSEFPQTWAGYYNIYSTNLSISASQNLTQTPTVGGIKRGRPKRREEIVDLRTTKNKYYETRFYYTELLAGQTDSDVPGAVKRTDPRDSVERWYILTTQTTGNYQNNSPYSAGATGGARSWPGTGITGFLTITASPNLTQFYQDIVLNPAKSNELNALHGVTGFAAYDLNYYMNRLSYPLTLTTNGGTIPGATGEGYAQSSQTYTKNFQYEQTVTLPTNEPTRAGYEFDGWFADSDFQFPYHPGNGLTMPASSLALYAKWRGTELTVNYYDGSTKIASGSYSMNDRLNVADLDSTAFAGLSAGAPVAGRGTFRGWFYQTSAGVMVQASWDMPVTANINLYADFHSQKYTVTFKAEGGLFSNLTDTTTAEVTSGSRNTLAYSGYRESSFVPVKEGYTLVGWYTAIDDTGVQFTTATPVTADITVYAHWRVTEYTVTEKYVDEGGNTISPDTTTSVLNSDPYSNVVPDTVPGYAPIGHIVGDFSTGTLVENTAVSIGSVTNHTTVYFVYYKMQAIGNVDITLYATVGGGGTDGGQIPMDAGYTGSDLTFKLKDIVPDSGTNIDTAISVRALSKDSPAVNNTFALTLSTEDAAWQGGGAFDLSSLAAINPSDSSTYVTLGTAGLGGNLPLDATLTNHPWIDSLIADQQVTLVVVYYRADGRYMGEMTVTVTIKVSIPQISATIPLKMTVVVDGQGNVLTPSEQNYYIASTTSADLRVMSVGVVPEATASNLFSNPENVRFELNSNSLTYNGSIVPNASSFVIPSADKLELDLEMEAKNTQIYVPPTETPFVNLTYTVQLVGRDED